MTNKETIEGLLGKKKECNTYGALLYLKSAHSYNEMHSKAVEVVEKLLEYKIAVESAREELGIKLGPKEEGLTEFWKGYRHGANDCHDISTPILAKAKARIEELSKRAKILEQYQFDSRMERALREKLEKELQVTKQANKAANKVIEEEINLKTKALLRIKELEKDDNEEIKTLRIAVKQQDKELFELQSLKEEIIKEKSYAKRAEGTVNKYLAIRKKLTVENVQKIIALNISPRNDGTVVIAAQALITELK